MPSGSKTTSASARTPEAQPAVRSATTKKRHFIGRGMFVFLTWWYFAQAALHCALWHLTKDCPLLPYEMPSDTWLQLPR